MSLLKPSFTSGQPSQRFPKAISVLPKATTRHHGMYRVGMCHSRPWTHVLREPGMDKPFLQCRVPIRAGSPGPTSPYSTYLPLCVPSAEHSLPLLLRVRGGQGWGVGRGVVVLHCCTTVTAAHSHWRFSLSPSMRSRNAPPSQAGHGQAPSNRTAEHSAT